jgi:hypothetical protein
MKKLLSVLCLFLVSCGEPLNFDPKVETVTKRRPVLVPGMILYFDASFVDGEYGIPPTPCGVTQWTDLSGYNNHGALSNFACNASSGFVGTGIPTDPYRLEFDGTNGEIRTNLDVQPSTLSSTTWEGWIYPTSINNGSRQTIFSADDGGYDRTLLIEVGTDKLSAFRGRNAVYQATALTPNVWQHVAVVYTSSDVLVYLNGQKFTSPQSFGGSGNSNSRLSLGFNPGYGENFNGSIAYLTVYDRALSDAEITKRCVDLQDRFDGAVCH